MKDFDNKKKIMLVIILLLSLVFITFTATYAFFTYIGKGLTENVIETGNITFVYEEIDKNGSGISITDAFPMSDEDGIKQSGSGKVFNFKVTSATTPTVSIPYVITARLDNKSTLDEDKVKIYLTEVNGIDETELVLNKYSRLGKMSGIAENITEREIHSDIVPAKSTNYEKNYRLRMWIDKDTNFSQNVDGTYPYNNKTFSIKVNVYANSKVVTVNE